MKEFDWIKSFLAPLVGKEGLNLEDDAALYTPPAGQDLILTKDTLVEGVHFLEGEYGADTAQRLLAVNLSDLAAKGARPVGYLLSTAWPKHLNASSLTDCMRDFAQGLANIQSAYNFKLFGGDTVRIDGPMTISATLLGGVPSGAMVRRSGAELGDIVWASGNIGDAHLGLMVALQNDDLKAYMPSSEEAHYWEESFRFPVPRLSFVDSLRLYANACADISDGVFSEALHIANASNLRIELFLSCVPLSEASQKWCLAGDEEERRMRLSSAGDDYELLFTAPSKHSHAIQDAAKAIGLRVTKIGRVTEGSGLNCVGMNGQPVAITKHGYSH
ncbi:thiamine-phosphate kinase [Litorimonas taeanensis]|uniref:Thiamine-monophosphate kinase n=1 Tax=Litorimonas taeanensis TaxID=568099 RepID=A0A420WKJ7_9PROT|nr:thiamine-phosphate kinase [Litorimonas taeanensis]RKQ71425.1 thiamine-phosphate kinase [Litorimonas taeanensis]